MKWLSDETLTRLQASVQCPDLSSTRYRALKFVARGGMGAVWLAEDVVLHRRVALKVLDVEDRTGELASRLEREALVLAHLEHPGIVPVHDAGTLPDGRVFYCMKYVEGQTLESYIVNTNLPQRLGLAQRIAEPLAFAHSKGIVHRDLKPGNIMIGAFGEVLIMDWGLAKITNSTIQESSHITSAGTPGEQTGFATAAPITSHGKILGTPGYMSPEQARGDSAAMDERSDIFSLGAILRFMLTGQSPEETPTTAPLPKPLNAICQKAMAPEISERYASIQEMSADISQYLEGVPISAYREGIVERGMRLLERHRVAVVLVLAYIAMRVLFILFSHR
ncbi:MAG TPA: serine/threonine-protein kinase [Terriglobales bacterium]|jgi:serine/threonine protein kinase|nr:serine/threonine-protein kinase [Terriglobales bacterium]